MKKYSVIIVNYNTRQLLLDCLRSIMAARHKAAYEIWVVDNASSDGSSEAVAAQFPQVRLISNPENLGFAKANNLALRQANGEICILLNPDTLVDQDFFEALLAGFDQFPGAGMIVPQILNRDGSIQPSWGRFSSPWTEFFFQFFLYKIFPSPKPFGIKIQPLQLKDYQSPHPVDWASGACMAVPKSVVEQVGGLDEDIFLYGEDMEWCYRIREKGYAIFYWPEAKITHLVGQSTRANYARWIENYSWGEFRFILQHSSMAGVRLAALWMLLGSLLRVMIFAFAWILFREKRKEASSRIRGYVRVAQMGWRHMWLDRKSMINSIHKKNH